MNRAPRPPEETLDPEFIDDEPVAMPRQRRRTSGGVYAFAVVLSLFAMGLGGYAWRLLNETEKLKGAVATLEQGKKEAQARVTELVLQNGEQQQRSEQAAGERDELKGALAATSAKLAELEDARNAIAERLAEFRDLRAKFQRMIDSGALDITFRRGRMIVEMPAAVLFDSGSAELSEAGKDTVVKVAKILRNVPRHRFLVGGHTDNVPAVKEYKSNWALSAARALEVTETLTGHGVAPKRLVLAGYSEHDPVAGNGSEAGRQKNRRIEIILEPYVEEKMVEGLLAAKTPSAAGK